jgi:hypothetical protein
MTYEYYNSPEQCFWEGPCNDRACPDCLRFHPIVRCNQEIAAHEAELRAGNPNVEGLCRALVDWSVERRMIQAEMSAVVQSAQNASQDQSTPRPTAKLVP